MSQGGSQLSGLPDEKEELLTIASAAASPKQGNSKNSVSLCGDDGGDKTPSTLHKTVHDTSNGDSCEPGKPETTASPLNDTPIGPCNLYCSKHYC